MKGKRKFVMVPEIWMEELAAMEGSGSDYRLALELLARVRWVPSRRVPLSNVAAGRAGVSRRTKWRVLQRLRKRGLVAVESGRGRAPAVKVRFVD